MAATIMSGGQGGQVQMHAGATKKDKRCSTSYRKNRYNQNNNQEINQHSRPTVLLKTNVARTHQ
jgi:hypothetical protein